MNEVLRTWDIVTDTSSVLGTADVVTCTEPLFGNSSNSQNNPVAEQVVLKTTASSTIEIGNAYTLSIAISGTTREVRNVRYEMSRRNREEPRRWFIIHNGISTDDTHTRIAWTPGFWDIRAIVTFETGEDLTSNVIQVEEQFPLGSRFQYDEGLRKHLSGTLWRNTVDYARRNADTHTVREYGSLIRMRRNGTFYWVDVPPGPSVALDREGAVADIQIEWREGRDIDPREYEHSLVVGTMHTHYPFTWAKQGENINFSRPTGPSYPADVRAEEPGILFDYIDSRIYAGHPVDMATGFFIYGAVRRATPE